MSTLTYPLWINLTPAGKTLILIFPGAARENISEALINSLGEPEAEGPLVERGNYYALSPDKSPEYKGPAYTLKGSYYMLFPHQNLPADLLDMAERMTSETIIQALEKNIPIGVNYE